ncbi:MAG: serine hydrolase domain-containing protein [Pseudomonadota bacterium]
MIRSCWLSRLTVAVAALFLSLGASSRAAQEPITPAALKSWADEVFGQAFAAKRFSGAAVGVVRDGETLLLQGYGWQDSIKQIPLDPQQTQLRMCSLSKSFTAVSALQLIERGQIPSLDSPVNDQLTRYQLPEPWGDQITLRHLMTHSSGMTGGGTPQGTSRDIPAPVSKREFAKLLKENLLRAPGQISLYANLGVAVEGALIEDVSGLPLAEYMRRNIFIPLGMNNTILHHTLATPKNLATPAAVFPNGEYQPVVFYPKHPAAAASGGIVATPEDMLRYAAFHADSTSDLHSDVLSSQSRALMRTAHFRADPLVDGVGLHLYPQRYGDLAMAKHGCGLPGFSSYMAVLPGLNLGVYITLMASQPLPTLSDLVGRLLGHGRMVESANAPRGELLRNTEEVWESFAKRFLPAQQMPELPASAEAPSQTLARSELLGSYWVERRPFSSLRKLFFAGSVREVSAQGSNGIRIDGEDFRVAGDGVYANVSDELDRVVFKRLDDGRVYFTARSAAWRQVNGLENPNLWSLCLIASLLLLLSGFFARFWRGPKTVNAYARPPQFAALAVLLLAVPAVVGTRDLGTMVNQYFNNDYLRISVFVITLNIAALLALWHAAGAFRWWMRVRDTLVGEKKGIGAYLSLLHATALAFAALALAGSMIFFNLVGLQLY